MTIDELKAAALRLHPEERARLASELLGSLNEMSDSEVATLWLSGAVRRDEELGNGVAEARPAADVFASARARRP